MLDQKYELLLIISLLTIVYIFQNFKTVQKPEFFAEYPKPAYVDYKLNDFQCYKQIYDPSKEVDLTKVYNLNDAFGDPRNLPTQNVGTLKSIYEIDCNGQQAYTIPMAQQQQDYPFQNIQEEQ